MKDNMQRRKPVVNGPIVVIIVVAISVVAVVIYSAFRHQRAPAPPDQSDVKPRQSSSTPKERLNVSVIGASGYPGVELSSAMLRVANHIGSADLSSLEKLKNQKCDNAAVTPFHYLEYETASRHYAHMLLLNPATSPRCLVLSFRMADVAILVAGAGGVTPELRRHVLLAETAGIPRVIIFIEGTTKSVTERDLEALFGGTVYRPRDVPIVGGQISPDTSGAARELLETLDRVAERRETEPDRPFLLPIEDVFDIRGRGIVVTGMVERGSVRVGDSVDLLGRGRRLPVKCLGIEIFKGTLTVAHGGDCVGVLLQGVERDQVSAGMVLAATGSLRLASRFRGRLHLLAEPNGDLKRRLPDDEDVELLVRTAALQAKVANRPIQGTERENSSPVDFSLSQSTPLEIGSRFAVLNGQQLVAVGSIEELIQCDND